MKTLTLVVELDDDSPAEAILVDVYKNKQDTDFLKGIKILAIGEGDVFLERDALREEVESLTPSTPLEIADREKIYEIAKNTREELKVLYKKLSNHYQQANVVTFQGAGMYGSILLSLYFCFGITHN